MIKFLSEQATTGVVAVVRPWEASLMRTVAPTSTSLSGHPSVRIAPTSAPKNGTDLPVALGSLFRSPPV